MRCKCGKLIRGRSFTLIEGVNNKSVKTYYHPICFELLVMGHKREDIE